MSWDLKHENKSLKRKHYKVDKGKKNMKSLMMSNMPSKI